MLITPHVSEKSYKLATDNVYVFDVPLTANKAEVIAAVVAENPDVTVRDVRLMITKGKPKAVNRGKRSRPGQTTRKDTKKAYVTLSDGKIEIAAFAEIENQTQAAEAEQIKASDVTASAAKQSSDKASKITRRRTGRRGDR
ncbi:50S ribosomal protein L23 [Candidatus Saccharibacteria bacterium]|nr:50S ribosomal protein L23 [Candidatus Saccharibacteria bacterium]